MGDRAMDLMSRLKAFNEEVITFLEKCSDEDWKKKLKWEEWSLGVTARHIGAGHYEIVEMAKQILNGEKLPEITMDQITEMANQHAREHGACSKEEVLDILRKNGAALTTFVAGLDDAQLDSSGYLAAMGSDITVQQLIEFVILESAGQHFANIKKAKAE